MEDDTLTDVVLVVEGKRFPDHRGVLAVLNTTQSEYCRGLFLSGMQGGSSEGGLQEIEQVTVGRTRWYYGTCTRLNFRRVGWEWRD